MFSGKTDHLIARLIDLADQGRRVIATKHALDRRYGDDELVTHSGVRFPARAIEESSGLLRLIDVYDVIGVDEAQFFDDELRAVSGSLRESGCHVVIAGLDFDFRRKPFETVAALSEVADRVVTRTATCSVCGGVAQFTERLQGGATALTTESRILVGGSELYEPRCRACHGAAKAVRSA